MAADKEAYSPHSHVPYGKDGSGYHSNNAEICSNTIMISAPLMLDAIRSTTVEPGSVFTIVDYGCADGGTSMPLMYACVEELRKIHGDSLPIQVVYEDQPVNDFKSLFLRLHDLLPGPKSYFLDFPNVFVTACGTSFYSQCLPSNSVQLGFSSTAMHWLRDKPREGKGAFCHLFVEDKETAEKLKKQAADDWELLMLQRTKEMSPGSTRVHIEIAINEDGQSVGVTKATPVSCFALLRDLWKDLVADGFITQEEYDNTFFSFRIRTTEEFKKPFDCVDSPVRKAGLSLVSMEIKMIPCPLKAKWLREGGDPKEYAQSYVPNIRRWSNATFMEGLSDSRSNEEKEKIVDELFKRYENDVAKRPGDHGLDFISAYMVMKKAK